MDSGLKVMMGNAVEDLKEIAEYIAPDVTHDGVAGVINKFILTPQQYLPIKTGQVLMKTFHLKLTSKYYFFAQTLQSPIWVAARYTAEAPTKI